MLTKKQKEALIFLKSEIARTGISPSYDEIKDAIGLASKSGIHRLITALEERGFIRRLPNKARAIEIIDKPSSQYFDGMDSHELLVELCSVSGVGDLVPLELRNRVNAYYVEYAASQGARIGAPT